MVEDGLSGMRGRRGKMKMGERRRKDDNGDVYIDGLDWIGDCNITV